MTTWELKSLLSKHACCRPWETEHMLRQLVSVRPMQQGKTWSPNLKQWADTVKSKTAGTNHRRRRTSASIFSLSSPWKSSSHGSDIDLSIFDTLAAIHFKRSCCRWPFCSQHSASTNQIQEHPNTEACLEQQTCPSSVQSNWTGGLMNTACQPLTDLQPHISKTLLQHATDSAANAFLLWKTTAPPACSEQQPCTGCAFPSSFDFKPRSEPCKVL